MTNPVFVIERYIANELHYWCAGACGRGAKDQWATDYDWATKFADDQSGQQVLFNLCGGEGRVVQHGLVSA